MYHIKHDKRAQAATELICAGLLACMKEKPFARITITDVQRASSVSRSTFYRNFDCLEDVLVLLCDRGFQAVFAARSALPPTWPKRRSATPTPPRSAHSVTATAMAAGTDRRHYRKTV